MKRLFSIFTIVALMLTMMPAQVEAASYIKTLNTYSVTQSSVSLSWTKLSSKQKKKVKGIAVFRNGYCVRTLSTSSSSCSDYGLAANTYYTYQVKTYKTSKQKQWYNKKTGVWQTKKPAKKYRGKSRKVTIYKYANASPARTIRTLAPPLPPAPAAPTGFSATSPDYNVLKLTWNAVSGASSYRVYISGMSTIGTAKTGVTLTAASGTYSCQIDCIKNGTASPKSAVIKVTVSDPPANMVTVTDYLGTTRNVAENSADYNNPKYNKNIDGTFVDGSQTFIQKNGVTFAPSKGNSGYSVDVYNGDPAKVSFEVSGEQSYTTWSPNLNNPSSIQMSCVMGQHGRRLATIERKAFFYGSSTTESVSSVSFNTTGLDNGNVTVTAKYNGITLATESISLGPNTSDGLSEDKRFLLDVGEAAVAYFENGGGYDQFTNAEYNSLKTSSGNYIAEMRAIEKYVRNEYLYSQFDCWVGADILSVYSVCHHGLYGHDCYTDPNNTMHRAFRPDDFVANGNASAYFETQGHK